MVVSPRVFAIAAAACGALALPLAGALPAASAFTSGSAGTGGRLTAHPARAAHPSRRPGRTGPTITLASGVALDGYDAAASASGTTYIGWIAGHGAAADRTVYLCTLPSGASRCAGGVRSTPSLGESSAAGLRVLVSHTGQVTLVWSHTTAASVNGPDGDEIAIATRRSDGSLSSPSDVAAAPSFGTLLDAALGPQGIWVTSELSGSSARIQVRPGLGNPAVTLRTPYPVGSARIAFTGPTAVLAIQKAGAITHPVSYSVNRGRSWSGFRAVARTWTSDANLGLVRTTSGIRLVASVSNANYWPVVSRWTGGSFSRPQLTGDRSSCSPVSHDPFADASGRMADVSQECDQLAVTNLPDTLHATVLRYGAGGTFANGIPQVATTPRGHGWVAWSVEGKAGNRLLAVPVLLPAGVRTVSHSSGGDRVRLTGPVSCLPPVDVAVRVAGAPARHWRITLSVLRLDGKAQGKTLHGAALTPGQIYTLTGSVTFRNGGKRHTVSATLRFRSCPNP